MAKKANKAINALRAQITLLQRERGMNLLARLVSTSVHLLLGVVFCCCLPLEPYVVSF
jgi:hypothetical protein